MPRIYPFMGYRDARAAAIEWLCRAFGFEKHATYDGQDGRAAHTELTLGADAIVMLGSIQHDTLGLRVPVDIGAVTGGIYEPSRTWTPTTSAPRPPVPRSCRSSPMTATGAATPPTTWRATCGVRRLPPTGRGGGWASRTEQTFPQQPYSAMMVTQRRQQANVVRVDVGAG